MNDLSFEQINNTIGKPIFTLNNNEIKLNVNLLTDNTYTSLNDQKIIELAFKFLKICYDAQEEKNQNNSETLNSFTSPVYGTVQKSSNPPAIEGSLTVTGLMTLNIDEISGILQ